MEEYESYEEHIAREVRRVPVVIIHAADARVTIVCADRRLELDAKQSESFRMAIERLRRCTVGLNNDVLERFAAIEELEAAEADRAE
jgi:hypothetical protein